uniref:Putative secreted protein n=1 Tax=Ixodes ricinus TaxID=34613 RepID=A0A6B0TSX1_IXORI
MQGKFVLTAVLLRAPEGLQLLPAVSLYVGRALALRQGLATGLHSFGLGAAKRHQTRAFACRQRAVVLREPAFH